MGPDQSPNAFRPRDLVGFGDPRNWGVARWRCACAGLVFAATLTCVAQDGHPAQAAAAPVGATSQDPSSARGKAPADSSANTQAKELDPRPQPPADSQRRKQISAESMQLLAMAVELKAEVDKTNKDTLSLKVIRKADAIEKLAKTVKEKVKQSSRPG